MRKEKSKAIIFLILAAGLSGFFIWQALKADFLSERRFKLMLLGEKSRYEAAAAGMSGVAINEIAWMGTALSANHEWIELKNLTAFEINLSGWRLTAADGTPSINLNGKILANGFFLLERTSDETVPEIAADQIFTGALANTGEKLELRDTEGNLVDFVDAIGGWPAGDNATKQTMERKADGSWQTSENPGGTPKAENSAGAPAIVEPEEFCGNGVKEDGEECDDGNNSAGDGCSSDCALESPASNSGVGGNESGAGAIPDSGTAPALNVGSILINEIVSDPADGEEEWIELYNAFWQTVDLQGWTIEEGSKAKTFLSGLIGPSGESRFIVLLKPKGNLNNKGDIVILKDKRGRIIDQVTYGNWDDGNLADNAPAASDPFSLARKHDGYNTGNNANDFAVTKTITKGAANSISAPAEDEEISASDRQSFDFSDSLVISEVYPNPEGDDSQSEFIEIFNFGARPINLFGWRLGDDSQRRFEFKKERIIGPGQYLAFFRSETKIALNNGGDSVKLFQPLKDSALEIIKYDKAREGWSYMRLAGVSGFASTSREFDWTQIATPNEANILRALNRPPEVDFDCPEIALVGVPIIFDSTDTVDPEGDELNFSWDFGDGIKNNLPSPQHTFLKAGNYNVVLIVSDKENTAKKKKVIKVTTDQSLVAGGGRNFLTDNASQAGKPLVIINEILPDPVKESDLTGEWIELYNQGNVVINLLNWRLEDSRGAGNGYKFKSERWLDIGGYLVISRPESKIALNNSGDFVRLFDESGNLVDEVAYDKALAGLSYARKPSGNWQWTTKLTPAGPNQFAAGPPTAAKKAVKKVKNYLPIALEQVNQLEAGDLVKVKGTVAVLPGVFSTQFFYIVGSPGVQIYSYKKDFPDLRVGDVVEVIGEVSEAAGEKRIKTVRAADIKIIEHRGEPEPKLITCEQLKADLAGQLVKIEGEIADRKSSTVYFDDGTEEAVVYIKKGTQISLASLKPGVIAVITGIVSLSAGSPRLLPRSPSDIVKKDEEKGEVLGEVAADEFLHIAARDKKAERRRYLLILTGGAGAVMLGLFLKAQKRFRQKEKEK